MSTKPCYAQVDDEGRCYAVTQPGAPIDRQDMIPVPDVNSDYLGKTWNPETSTWSD